MPSIFERFWWIFEAKLTLERGAKRRRDRPRQAKTGQDKGREGNRREGKGKEEEGKGLEGKGVEKCGGGPSAAGGGGVRQTLRGGPPQGPGGGSRGVGISYFDFLAILVPSIFPSFFSMHFWADLGSIVPPTCLPKPTKIQEKSIPRCHPC